MATSSQRRPRLPVFAVILAGGRSTRFWPLARTASPKQLLRLYGRGTLVQQTAARLRRVVPWSRILVATTPAYTRQIRQQLPRIPPDQILVEASGRGTAPCLTLASEWVQTRVGEGVLIATPADHRVGNVDAYAEALRAAVAAAAQGHGLITIGMTPTRPETGYGYIQVGKRVAGSAVHRVVRFREKPTAAVARRLMADGAHLWNSGIFVWRTSDFLRAVERELPATAMSLKGIWREPARSAARIRRAYNEVDEVSVDVGVLEPLSRRRQADPKLCVLRAAFDWSDVGSWSAMADLWAADEHGNASRGRLLSLDSSGCVVHAPKHVVVALGVKDLVIVEAGGAMLICPRARAQEVRRIAAELRQRRLQHLT